MAIFLLVVLTLGTLWYWSYGSYINDEDMCKTGWACFVLTVLFGWVGYAGLIYNSGETRRLYKEEYSIIKKDGRVFFVVPGKYKDWTLSTRDFKKVSDPDSVQIYRSFNKNLYGASFAENIYMKDDD